MKKKFINGLLMAALSVATVGSFVACTDHEDDRLLEVQKNVIDSNTELKRIIDGEIADLQRQIDELKAAKCTCGDIKGWVEEQLKLYLKISDAPTDYLTLEGAKQYFYLKSEIDEKFYTKSEINDLLEKFKCKCKEDGFSEQDIINILNKYGYVTEGDVTNIVNNLLKNYYTKEEVENLLKNYVTNEYLTQNFYTKEEVANFITNVLNKYYTAADVDSIFNNYYTKEEILNLIGGEGGLTAEQVKEIVKLMLKEYYTKIEIFYILQNYYTKGQIDEMLANIKSCECGDALTIEEIMLLINIENGGNYYNKEQIDNLIGDFVTQDQMVTYVTTQINNLETKMQNWVLTYQFGDKKVTIDQLVNDFYALQVEFGTYKNTVDDLVKRVETLEGYYEKYKELLENLANTYEAVYKWYDLYKDIDLIQVQADAKNANDWVEANKDLVERLKHDVDSLKQLNHGGGTAFDPTELQNQINDLYDKLSKIKSCECTGTCTCGLNEDKVKELIKEAIDKLDIPEGVDVSQFVTKAQMDQAIKDATDQLKEDVETLKTTVKEQGEAIDAINEKLKDMATIEYVDKAVNDLKKNLITSMTLNGTWSPVLGEGAAPVGLNLNLLCAYHGEALDEIAFPSNESQYLANPVEKVLKDADLDILEKAGFSDYYEKGAGNLYYGKDEGKDANAGKLYFTINPNTVDFTGVDLTVENSVGWTAPLNLNNVKKSDHKLTWGYTRADNGLYEADAEIEPAKMNQMKARLDLGAMKDLAADLKDFRTKGFDVTKIVSTIYAEAGDILDRYAVVAATADGRKIYSDYALAATTVKPLGFFSVPLESYKQENVPGLEQVETFINNVRGQIFDALSKALEKLDIDKIQAKIDDFDWSKFTVKDFDEDHSLCEAVSAIKINLMNTKDFNEKVYVWVSDDLWNGHWEEAEIYGYAGESYIYVKINLYWEFKRLYTDMGNPINDGVAYIKDFLASQTFQDMLDLLDGLEDRLNGYADTVENAIMKYLNMFNKRMVRYLDPNDYLKTVLFVKDGIGYTRVSMSVKRPTASTSTTVKLMPTTFNADMISPSYKKFVAVTNVWKADDPSKSAKNDDADCFNELKSANGQAEMMEVTEGNKQVIEFTGKAGYKYEILYGALDFNGKGMYKKYYIQF